MGPDTGVRALAVVTAAVFAGAVTTAMSHAGAGLPAQVGLAALVVAGTLAVAECLLRARRAADPHRLAWAALAGSIGVEISARWCWRVEAAGAGHPLHWPSLTAPLHVTAVVLAAFAVRRMAAPHQTASAMRRGLLDAATIVAAVSLVTGNSVFATSGAGTSGGSMAYASMLSAADVALAALAMFVLSRARFPGGVNLRTLLPVCAGAVALAAGNAGLVSSAIAGGSSIPLPVDLFTTGGFVLLIGGACAWDGEDDSESMRHRERIAVCAAVGPVVLAALAVATLQVSQGRLPAPMALGVMFVAGLLLARLIVALLDNLLLSRTLESQVAERTLELMTQEHWFRSLVQHSSDVVSVVDASGVIRYQSPAAERLFGYDPASTVGSTFASLVRRDDVGRLHAALARGIGMPGASFTLEFAVAHRDGGWRETETVVTSLLDVPDVRGVVLNTRDVSDRKQLQERLTHQAFHDALTGLANRSLFQHELGSALAVQPRDGIAVLFCDLDGFKAVNDSQGHDVGDALLGIVAERLRNCVRPRDLVARFGGDEFAVLVREVDAVTVAGDVAARIAASVSAPIALEGRELRVGVSIGIAANTHGADSVDVVLRNADLAMYRAKGDQHAAVAVFEPAMHDALLARIAVEDDLRAALGGGQLVLHYQPTVHLATGIAVGVEALMRWYRPGRGIVSPKEFISVAEDNGFIDAMGQWALFSACRQAAAWQPYAPPGSVFGVGVNISARQVTPALVDTVAAALAEAGLPPGALLLEMTESVLLGRTDEAIEVLRALKRLGVRLAIDDFGTGFSSLSYLSRFPVDVLKIDKHFIDAVDRDGERAELARTIVQLGRSLQLATIAEGIETHPQWHALREMGCEFGQGYLFSRPVPASGVSELLQVGVGPVVPVRQAAVDLAAGA